MKTLRLYILAALPAMICLLLWKGATFAAVELDCVVHGNELSVCRFMDIDVTGILGWLLFWGSILIIPATLISIILLAAVPELHRRAANPALKKDAEKRSAP
jgi:hypothetical protein